MTDSPDTHPDMPPAIQDDGRPTAGPTPPPAAKEPEIGGPKGPEPTRYGDWTVKGRCIDF